VSEEDTSTEVEAGAVSSDEEVEQNEDIWIRADATPVTKSCSNERSQYVGFLTLFGLQIPKLFLFLSF